MNKCGCPPIKEKFEYPITELNSYLSYFTNSNFSLFPRSCTIDDLKRKVVKEFYGILSKLLCGIYLNLDFLLDEISLIDKYKYDLWNEEYSPSSTYQFINPTKNTSSGIDLDLFYTKDEINDILKLYIQEGDITNNFEDIINLPSTLDGYGIVDAVSKEELSLLEEEVLKREIDPTIHAWAKLPNKPTYTALEVGALPENTPLFSGNYNDLTNKPILGVSGTLLTFTINLPDNTFNQPLSVLDTDSTETLNMFECSTLEEFNTNIITKVQQGYYAKVIYNSNESICQTHYVEDLETNIVSIPGLFYNYFFSIIVTVRENNIYARVKYILLQNLSNLLENKSILSYLTTESSNPNFIANSSGNWTLSSDYKHWVYPVNGLRKITITANSSVSTYYTFLKYYTKGSTASPTYATGYTTAVGVPAGQTVDIIVPLDANYLYLNTGLNEAAKPEEILVTGVSVVERRGTSSLFVKADGSVDNNTYLQLLLNASNDFVKIENNKAVIKNDSGDTMLGIYSGSELSDSEFLISGASGTLLVSADVLKRWFDKKQEEITSTNKLNADLIDDAYSTLKVVNVKPNWNANAGTAAEILNKPDIYTKTEIDALRHIYDLADKDERQEVESQIKDSFPVYVDYNGNTYLAYDVGFNNNHSIIYGVRITEENRTELLSYDLDDEEGNLTTNMLINETDLNIVDLYYPLTGGLYGCSLGIQIGYNSDIADFFGVLTYSELFSEGSPLEKLLSGKYWARLNWRFVNNYGDIIRLDIGFVKIKNWSAQDPEFAGQSHIIKISYIAENFLVYLIIYVYPNEEIEIIGKAINLVLLEPVAFTGNYNDLSDKPTIPTVPTISTDISSDSTSDTKTASPKAVKTFVEGKGYITDVSGKQDVIDSSHKLSADLIEDGTTNKVINVKPDWDAASGDAAEILHKPTIPTITFRTWSTT